MAVDLHDLVRQLQGLPPAELQKLADAKAAAAPVWIPNPGPQTDAYLSPADVLLYGGQAAGGKTDLSLGLAFTAHRRSLILRRKYANLGGLTERAIKINGSRNGFNGSPPPLLRTADGRYIQFAGNQHLGDEQDWQGIPFDLKCVGRGTPVIMADWSRKPIEEVVVGDMVATLEGPRRVTRLLPVRWDEAVRVSLYDANGELVCFQDQSLTHEVLTPEGWVCHDTSDVACRPSSSAPIEYRGLSTPSESCGTPSARSSWPHRTLCSGRLRIGAAVLVFLERMGCLVSSACAALPLPGTSCEASYASRQGVRQPHGLFALLAPSTRSRASRPKRTSRRSISSTRGCGVGSLSSLRDWLGRCWSCLRHDGERARRSSGLGFGGVVDLVRLRLPDGVEQPSPKGSEVGGRVRTPTHSHQICTYIHPYTKETRSFDPSLSVENGAFSFSKVGVKALYDLEIEEVNHFITEGGIINRNCFDEATQFLEPMVRFHLGWLRQADGEQNQRTRAILATNPPVNADGDWIIGMFRPWLDITHHKPAKPGELRWYVTAEDGSDVEVDDKDLVRGKDGRRIHKEMVNSSGQPLLATSRTFIPAKLSDNPFLADTGYAAQLDALPEPLRSAVRDGNFMAARSDAEFQVIPTQWVIEAQARWKPDGHRDIPMTAMAYDPAGGGNDAAELGWRHGAWFASPVTTRGEETADGSAAAALIIKHRRDHAPIVVDVGGGYGGAVTMRLSDNEIPHIGFNGAHAAAGRTKDRQLSFVNERAAAWWRLREALDPDQPGGSPIALPPDTELRSDLTTPTFEVTIRGIKVESKEEIRKRIGRSPGKGDVAVMLLSKGDVAVAKANRDRSHTSRPAFANVGHASAKRRR